MTDSHADKPGNPTDSTDVCAIFGQIAPRYDLTNRILSLGIDRAWRKRAVREMRPLSGRRILDMCCGTGDLAFAFASEGAQVVACDLSPRMIEMARAKKRPLHAKHKQPPAAIEWRICDCTATDLQAQSFDVVSCAFGVRNMADLTAGINEMYRLLRPGGRACILEFSLPPNPLIRAAYLAHFRWIMPPLAGLIAGRTAPYRYLRDSVLHWHRNVDLPQLLCAAGFSDIHALPLTFGITTLHLAARPADTHSS